MPSTKELRRRIRSVKNTAQITKAMQMVAATKMRRAQNQALGGRPYSETLQLAVAELMPAITLGMNPLLQPVENEKVAVLLLTTDKSLCGALNANVLRMVQQVLSDPHLTSPSKMGRNMGGVTPLPRGAREKSYEEQDLGTSLRASRAPLSGVRQSHTVEFFTVGRKGRDFVVKTGKNLSADFENSDLVSFKSARQIANVLMESFLEKKIGRVFLLYPDFVSTLRQEPKLEQLLPISQEELLRGLNVGNLANTNTPHPNPLPLEGRGKLKKQVDTELKTDFVFDSSKQELVDFVLRHFVQQKVYQALLETKASEHSARMIAMKNATDAAKELVLDLNLAYNRTRQEGITKELLEITSALAALE